MRAILLWLLAAMSRMQRLGREPLIMGAALCIAWRAVTCALWLRILETFVTMVER